MDSKIGLKITHTVINSHSGSPHQSVHFDQIQGIFQDFTQEWVNFKGGGGKYKSKGGQPHIKQ